MGLALAPATAGSEPQPPMRVSVGKPMVTNGWSRYRLIVLSAGSPIMVALPGRVHYAALVVNGKTVSRAGRDFNVALRNFGHGASGLQLANLRTTDSVVIQERGDAGAPLVVGQPGIVAEAFSSGIGSGVFYGILLTIVLFQIVAVFALKDQVFAWSGLWTLSVIGIEFGRDNIFGLTQTTTLNILLGLSITAQLGYVGFVGTFLHLRTAAPRLLGLLVATNVVATLLPVVITAATGQPPQRIVIYAALMCGTGVGVAIALLRRSSGFRPAAFLAVGLLGTFAVFLGAVLRAATGFDSEFLDRWSLEIGCSFDFLVFALGIAYRARFSYQEHEAVKEALREASIAAGNDPLTSLLNRRGLELWLESSELTSGTLLFVDIDDFKAINDRGGHMVGDDVLSVVGRIIRHAVRDQDAVSRFGGDEYVVILNGSTDDAVVDDVVARISSAVAFLLPLGAKSDLRVVLSIGRAPISSDVPFSEALKLADADTYRIKAEHHAQSGKARGQRAS